MSYDIERETLFVRRAEGVDLGHPDLNIPPETVTLDKATPGGLELWWESAGKLVLIRLDGDLLDIIAAHAIAGRT